MSSSDSEATFAATSYENLSEKIIHEVKNRPVLYDTTSRQYHDRNMKAKLWDEVYQYIYDNWGTLSENEKKKKGITIQKKWKNMRDCFLKELAARRAKSGQGAIIKKKKYIHFDSLLFLIPSLQTRKAIGGNMAYFPTNKVVKSEPRDVNRTPVQKINTKNVKPNDFERQIIELLKEKNTSDEDTIFSQMLVPIMKKLKDEQKHYAKIEILNILQKAKSYPFPLPSQGISTLPSHC